MKKSDLIRIKHMVDAAEEAIALSQKYEEQVDSRVF